MTTIETLLADLEADAPVRQVLAGAFWTVVAFECRVDTVAGTRVVNVPAVLQAP